MNKKVNTVCRTNIWLRYGFFIFAICALLLPIVVRAQTFHSLDLLQPIPLPDGTPGDSMLEAGSEGFFLSYLNDLVTWIAGILGMVCVGIFIFSGFQIMANFGNTEAVTQAKERILSAVFGLILLVTAALLLHTINPGFFRWSNNDPNPPQTGIPIIVELTVTKEGICNDIKDEAKKDLERQANECLTQHASQGASLDPIPPNETVKESINGDPKQCWVKYTQKCKFYMDPAL